MKVSIVVPVYNKAAFLEDCFNSLFAQSYPDFELIAVDDASTDDSLARLRALRDPRLRILALEKNLGPGLAAQRGMDEARGEYILRVDADDVQLAERVAEQIRFMDAHADIGASSAQMDLIGEAQGRYHVPLDHEALRVELLFGVALFQPVMALRRSVLEEHGIRYHSEWPRFGEDWLLQLELARSTRMANVDKALVRYRIGPQNSATGRDRKADLELLFRKAFAEFGFPMSGAELDLQLYTARYFKHLPPTPIRLKAYQSWLRSISAHNRKSGTFDQALLDERLARAWNMLFHHMPAFGWQSTWAYWRLAPTFAPSKIRYLLSALLNTKREASLTER